MCLPRKCRRSWLILRTSGCSPAGSFVREQRFPGLTQQMQQALAGVDPDLPISGFYGMNEVLAEALLLQHVEVGLLAVTCRFGALALFGWHLWIGLEPGQSTHP